MYSNFFVLLFPNVDFQFFYVSVCSISVSSQVKLVNHQKDVLEEFLSSHFFLAGS